MQLRFFSGGVKVFHGAVKDLPLQEEVVIKKSIEFYDDPEPCFIHRGAVMTRLYEELSQFFETAKGGEIPVDDIPPPLLGYLDLSFDRVDVL